MKFYCCWIIFFFHMKSPFRQSLQATWEVPNRHSRLDSLNRRRNILTFFNSFSTDNKSVKISTSNQRRTSKFRCQFDVEIFLRFSTLFQRQIDVENARWLSIDDYKIRVISVSTLGSYFWEFWLCTPVGLSQNKISQLVPFDMLSHIFATTAVWRATTHIARMMQYAPTPSNRL